MKTTLLPLLPLLCLGTASAATLVQSKPFAINQTVTAVTGSTQVVDGDFFTATVNPFDSGTGALDSFTLTWTLSGSISAVLSNPGGAINVGYSGNFLIAGQSFPDPATLGNGSGGGGSGSGGPGGMSITLPLTTPGNPLSFSYTFLVSGAGTDYDAAILAAILGGAPVTLEWDTPLTVNGNLDTLTTTANGSVELAYNYTAVPEPSAAWLALAAGTLLVRRKRR